MKTLSDKRGATALGILGYIIAVILIIWGALKLYYGLKERKDETKTSAPGEE